MCFGYKKYNMPNISHTLRKIDGHSNVHLYIYLPIVYFLLYFYLNNVISNITVSNNNKIKK